nr:polyprotein [Alphaendornavirus sp.]
MDNFKNTIYTHTEVKDSASCPSLAEFTTRQLISFVGQLQDGTTYTRIPAPGFSEFEESIAWKGDILLYDHATTYILNKYGKRDTILRSQMVSNKTMQKFMKDTSNELIELFGVTGGSEHTIGTCFEIIYYFNTTFRLDYFRWFTKSEVEMSELLVWNCDFNESLPPPKCWHLLFKNTPKSSLEFSKDDVLTKRQLIQIAETNELETSPILELERVTDTQFAVVPGNRTAQQLIDTMTHKVRISGDYSHGSDEVKNAYWHKRAASEVLQDIKHQRHTRSVSDSCLLPRKTEHYGNSSARHKRRFAKFEIQKVPGVITKVATNVKANETQTIDKPLKEQPPYKSKFDIYKEGMELGGDSDCWWRLWEIAKPTNDPKFANKNFKIGTLNNGGKTSDGKDKLYLLDADYTTKPKNLEQVVNFSYKNHLLARSTVQYGKQEPGFNGAETVSYSIQTAYGPMVCTSAVTKTSDFDLFNPVNTWLQMSRHDDKTVHLHDIVMAKNKYDAPDYDEEDEEDIRWYSLEDVWRALFPNGTEKLEAEESATTFNIDDITNEDVLLGGDANCWFRLQTYLEVSKAKTGEHNKDCKLITLNNEAPTKYGPRLHLAPPNYTGQPKPLKEVIDIAFKQHCKSAQSGLYKMIHMSTGIKNGPDTTWLKFSKHKEGVIHLEDMKVVAKLGVDIKLDEAGKTWFTLQQVWRALCGKEQPIPDYMPVEVASTEKPELDPTVELEQSRADKQFNYITANRTKIEKEIQEKFSDCLLGVGAGQLMRSKFMESLELATDDHNGREYVTAVTDHDLRAVNNHWARIDNFTFIKTTKPDRRLDDRTVRDLDNILAVTTVETASDPTHTFILDVACAFSYINCNPDKTEISGDVQLILAKQDWFVVSGEDTKNTLITFSPTMHEVRAMDATYIIGPCISTDNEGYLSGELGYYKHDSSGCEYSFGTTSKVYHTGWWTQLLAGENNYASGKFQFTVISRVVFGPMQVILVTPLKYDRNKVVESESRFFDIPMIDSGSLWATNLPLIKTVRVNINKVLLKRLINKNLTGKVGRETMLEYGMALSWYSYNKRGVEVSNSKIDPFDIKTHVYVANVLIRRQQLSTEIKNKLTTPGIPATMFAAAAAMIEHWFEKVDFENPLWTQIVRQLLSKLAVPNIKGSAGTELESWDGIDAWTLRTELTQSMSGKTALCNHHTTCFEKYTGNLCTCCLALTAPENESKCKCCQKQVTCVHVCSNDHDGNIKCKCCGNNCSAEYCDCCIPNSSYAFGHPHDHATGTSSHGQTDTSSRLPIIATPIGNVYNNRPTNTVALGNPEENDFMHLHTCVVCGKKYSHGHRYNHLNHRQHTKECPHCNPKRKDGRRVGVEGKGIERVNAEVGVPQGKVTKLEGSVEDEKVATYKDPHTIAELQMLLPINAINILKGEINDDALVSTNPGKLSTVPFITKPHGMEPLDNFKLTSLEEKVGGDCGENCIRHYVGPEWNEILVKRATGGRTKDFTGLQLHAILGAYGLNGAVVEKIGVSFSRVNESEDFAAIISGDALDETSFKEHWIVGKIKRTGYINNPKYANPLSNPGQHETTATALFRKRYLDLLGEEKITVSYMLAIKNEIKVIGPGTLPSVKGNMFSNGTKHDLQKGQFNFNMKDSIIPYVQHMVDSFHSRQVADILNAIWDVNDENINDVEYHTIQQARDICLNVARLMNNPVKYSRPRKMMVIVDKNKNKFLDLTDTKVKNGDIIFIASKGVYQPVVVNMTQQRLTLDPATKLDNVVNLLIPKSSFMSNMMRLYSVSNATCDKVKLEHLLSNANVVSGYGGTGKTTLIKKWVEDNPNSDAVFIACTSGGEMALRDKLPKNSLIMTFEKATYSKPRCKNYFFDEATLIRPWELGLIIDKDAAKVFLSGDPLQISVIDMYTSPGSRLTLDVIKYCEQVLRVQVDKLTTSYRFGDPLIKELKQHPQLADLESKAKQNTYVETYTLSEWNASELISLCKPAKVVLCFYDAHVTKTRTMLSGSSIKTVKTVHAMQGLEEETVAVIQSPLSNSNADTHLALGHCISAATRATKRLIWISVNCYDEKKTLHQRLGEQIAGIDFDFGKDVELPTIVGGDTQQENSFEDTMVKIARKESPPEYDIKKFNGQTFKESIEHFTKIAKTKKTRVKDGKVLVEFKVFGQTNEVEWDGHSVKGPVPSQHLEHLNCVFKWSSTGDAKHLEAAIKLNEIGTSRTRIIGYVAKVYEVNKRQLKLTGSMENWTVESMDIRSCAACGEIVFISPTGNKTSVSKDYLRSDRRTVTGEDTEFLVSILNDAKPWDILNPVLDDVLFSQAILAERIHTFFADIISKPISFNKWMDECKMDNRTFVLALKNEMDFEAKLLEVDNMYWMPVKRTNIFKKRKIRTIIDGTEFYSNGYKNKSLQDLCYDVLNEMYNYFVKDKPFKALISKVYMTTVGALDLTDRIPGMIENISWHKDRKTRVYSKLTKDLGLLKIKSMKYEVLPIFVPNNVAEAIHKIHPELSVAGNNKYSMLEPFEIAADIIATTLVYNTHPNAHLQTYSLYTPLHYVADTEGKNGFMPGDQTQRTTATLLNYDYTEMLKKHMVRLDGSSDKYKMLQQELNERNVYTGEWKDYQICLLPSTVLENFQLLNEMRVNRYKNVYFWLPNKKVNVDGRIVMKFEQNSPYATEISKELYNSITDGDLFSNVYWHHRVHVVRVLDGITIFEMISDNMSWATPWEEGRGFVWLEVPNIILDPRRIMDKKNVLETVRKRYDLTVLGNLRRRLLRPGTTFDDLLVQARTLVNTAQFSTSQVYSKYDVQVSDMYECAKLAYVLDQTENRMLGLLNSDSFIGDLTLAGVGVAAEMVTKIIPDFDLTKTEDLIPEDVKPRFAKLIYDFLNKLEMLRPVMLHGRKRFVNFYNINTLGLDRVILNTIRGMFNQKTKPFDKSQLTTLSYVADCPRCIDSGASFFAENCGLVINRTYLNDTDDYAIVSNGCTHTHKHHLLFGHDICKQGFLSTAYKSGRDWSPMTCDYRLSDSKLLVDNLTINHVFALTNCTLEITGENNLFLDWIVSMSENTQFKVSSLRNLPRVPYGSNNVIIYEGKNVSVRAYTPRTWSYKAIKAIKNECKIKNPWSLEFLKLVGIGVTPTRYGKKPDDENLGKKEQDEGTTSYDLSDLDDGPGYTIREGGVAYTDLGLEFNSEGIDYTLVFPPWNIGFNTDFNEVKSTMSKKRPDLNADTLQQPITGWGLKDDADNLSFNGFITPTKQIELVQTIMGDHTYNTSCHVDEEGNLEVESGTMFGLDQRMRKLVPGTTSMSWYLRGYQKSGTTAILPWTATKHTENVVYYCKECGLLCEWKSFVTRVSCPEHHMMTVIGHPKGKCVVLPFEINVAMDAENLTGDCKTIAEENEHMLALADNDTGFAFGMETVNDPVESTKPHHITEKYNSQLTVTLDFDYDPKPVTIGRLFNHILYKYPVDHWALGHVTYLSMWNYEWVQKIHRQTWFLGNLQKTDSRGIECHRTSGVDFEKLPDLCPVSLWNWVDKDKGYFTLLGLKYHVNSHTIELVDEGAIHTLLIHLLTSIKVINQPWMINTCPEGFQVTKPRIDYFTCCTGHAVSKDGKVDETLAKEEGINDWARRAASLGNSTRRSYTLLWAQTHDGLSYGLAQNSWNLVRPAICNTHHGSKLPDGMLPVDTAVPIMHVSRYGDHFTSWPGAQDYLTHLRSTDAQPNSKFFAPEGCFLIEEGTVGLEVPEEWKKINSIANPITRQWAWSASPRHSPCNHPFFYAAPENKAAWKLDEFPLCNAPGNCEADLYYDKMFTQWCSYAKEPERAKRIGYWSKNQIKLTSQLALASFNPRKSTDLEWYERYMGYGRVITNFGDDKRKIEANEDEKDEEDDNDNTRDSSPTPTTFKPWDLKRMKEDDDDEDEESEKSEHEQEDAHEPAQEGESQGLAQVENENDTKIEEKSTTGNDLVDEMVKKFQLSTGRAAEIHVAAMFGVRDDSPVDLPTELLDELTSMDDEPFEMYTNVAPMDRYKKGRDWTNLESPHFIAKKFGQGKRLTLMALQALTILRKEIINLGIKQGDIINYYVFHEGIAERNPSNTMGRHVCFTTNPNKYKARGFETIRLHVEPGRFGACLRPIACMLTPIAKCSVSHGGRVNLQGLWLETVLNRLIPENNENFTASVWNTISPYMDCYVCYTRPKDAAKFISTNILYGELYGIDEHCMESLGLTKSYYLPNAPIGYTHISYHPKYNMLKEKIKPVPIPDVESYWPDIPLKFVIDAARSTYALPLAWHLDGNVFRKETRGFGVHSNEEFKKWFAEYVDSAPDSRKLRLGLEASTTKAVYQYTFKTKTSAVEAYNPMVSVNCVRICIEKWLRLSDLPNVEELIATIHLKGYATQLEIEATLFGLNVNYDIFTTARTGFGMKINEGPTFQAKISEPQAGTKHFSLINSIDIPDEDKKIKETPEGALPSRKRRKVEENNRITKALIDFFEDVPYDEKALAEADKQLLNNAKARSKGRMDKIMQRKNHVVRCDGVIVAADTMRIANVRVNELIFLMTEKGWTPTVAYEIEDAKYVYTHGAKTVITSMCITSGADTGIFKVGEETKDWVGTKYLRTGNTIGFLTPADKLFAMDIGSPMANHPVQHDVDILVFRNFDNRKHHNYDHRTLVRSKLPGSVRILQLEDQRPITLEELLALKIDSNVMGVIINGRFEIDFRQLNFYADKNGYQEVANTMTSDEKVTVIEAFKEEDEIVKMILGIFSTRLSRTYQDGKHRYTPHQMQGAEINERLARSDRIKNSSWYQTMGKYKDGATYDVTYYSPMWEKFKNKEWSSVARNDYVYDHISGESATIQAIGKGYMDYAQAEIDAVKVDERVVETHNLIDSLGKAKIKPKTDEPISEEHKATLQTVINLNNIMYNDESDQFELIKSNGKGEAMVLYGTSTTTDPINGECYIVPTDAATMNYWDDETAMIGGIIETPRTNIKLQVRDDPEGLAKIKKTVLAKYPSHGQPAYTKRWMAGVQANVDLFGKVLHLRQVEHDPREDAEKFVETYFVKGAMNGMPSVEINYKDIIEWLRERPDFQKIVAEVDEILSSGLDVHGLDRVNVHLKLESRMKDKLVNLLTTELPRADNGMPGSIEEQRIRLIVWQRKGITCMFAPFFLKVKENLKRVLRKEIVYVDGMTPQQISALLNTIDGDVTFAEDDLKKQDRQTDDILLDTEMEIYKKLGANRAVVDLWRKVHVKWRAKGVGVKFVGNASRHTGQATTALGNVVVNLTVKMRLVNLLGKRLKLMLVLGDDNIILAKGEVSQEDIITNSARHFNMVSEAIVSKHNGGFLRMIIYKNNVGSLECGPDVIRLRRRFEVLNGVSEASKDNIEARAKSYACMLGGLKPVEALNEKHNWGLMLSRWYDFQALANATAIKYKCTTEYVESELGTLISMMDLREETTYEKLMITTKAR